MSVRRCQASDFRLDATLASGQVFRWQQAEGWYVGLIDGHLVRVRQDGEDLLFDADAQLTDERFASYFSLDQDLETILRTIDCDEHIHDAIGMYRGMRLLRQDPWECTLSYLLTSFNNIQRITRMIENLCQQFGRPLPWGQWRAYTFPTPEALADAPLGRLGLLGLGFRAAHVSAVARRFADRSFRPEALRDRPYAEVKAQLMELPGVGDKVADCIALFAFDQYAAFPIDVWVRRALALYMPQSQLTTKRMHAFAAEHFGPYAGYAQQYLYHWLRQRAEYTEHPAELVQRRSFSRLLLRTMPSDGPVQTSAAGKTS